MKVVWYLYDNSMVLVWQQHLQPGSHQLCRVGDSGGDYCRSHIASTPDVKGCCSHPDTVPVSSVQHNRVKYCTVLYCIVLSKDVARTLIQYRLGQYSIIELKTV